MYNKYIIHVYRAGSKIVFTIQFLYSIFVTLLNIAKKEKIAAMDERVTEKETVIGKRSKEKKYCYENLDL